LVNYEDDEETREYLVAATKRKREQISKEHAIEKNQEKRPHRSLKDNPRPFATPAMRKKEERELENIEIPPPKSQIHPSIMTQPLIHKEKEKEKELKEKEIRMIGDEQSRSKIKGKEPLSENEAINDDDMIDSGISEDNNTQDTTKSSKELQTLNKLVQSQEIDEKPKTSRISRNIQMINGNEEYDVIKNLNESKCDISFAQLLNVAPKIRSQVSQGLKLEKPKGNIVGALNNMVTAVTVVNNAGHTYKSKCQEVQEEDIAMVDVTVEDVPGKALIDSCSNLNIITRNFYNKLPGNYETVGVSRGRIRLATMNDKYSEGEIIRIPIKIKDFQLTADFRIVDDDDPFYDMLINLKTQIDNKLFIHPVLYSLCKFSSKGLIEVIAPINNNYEEEEKLACVVRKVDENKNPKSKLKEMEGLSPNEYIHDKRFQATLNKEYKEQILRLLEENIDIVATSSEELTPSKLAPHKINLKPNAKPVKQRSYRLSKFKSEILKDELTKLLNKKLIVPSYSEWCSPVVIVPKSNGKWRVCIDFRKVNDLTIKDSYSLPYIDEIFDSLDGAKIFTTMDLYSGYHQILMDEESVEITSFTTKFGNYQFKVMPFGLTGAPATFQREMNRILFPLIGKCVFNFIDDILIYSKTVEEHIEHIKQVLAIFKEHKLKINIEKCHFMQTEVEVLGHKVSDQGLSPQDSKIEAIRNWKEPTNVHELRSFLGAIGYYRNFIKNYAKITAPLCKLLRKGIKYKWNQEHQGTFETLKSLLINAPILKFPQFDKEFIIRTDASYDGIGGVLLQKDDETQIEMPIHFISRSLSKAEKNYSITDLEGTALFYCITKLKSYIMGNPHQTIIYTDHKPLLGLLKNKEPSSARHTRWCLEVSMLNVDIRYESGKKNVVADALSRMKLKDDMKVLALKITHETNEDMVSKVIKDFINEKFTTINGEDYFIDGNNYRKLITDVNERIKLILEAHNIGHEGYYKTYQRLRRSHYWNDMVNDVKRVISKCEKCQLNRPQPYPDPMESIPTEVEGPFTHLGLDIIGPLTKTRNNNQYIIVVVDYFTKWVEAEPTENITSYDVVKFLINIFARHGVPQVITTDNGVQFTSDMTKMFLNLYDVYVKFTTTYHPESNGLTENRNKEIGKLLRLLGKKNKDWDEVLPSALWALRTTKNTVTNHSSFELVYGREDQQPFDIAARPTKGVNKSSDEVLLEKFISHYRWTLEACKNIKNANKYWSIRRQEKQSMNQAKEIKIGDLVLVRNISRTKLEPYFVGPFKVIKKQFNTVTLEDPNSGLLLNRNVHLKNIIKYNSTLV